MRSDDLPRVEHFSALFYLSKLSIYCSSSLVIVPPSSFFGVFTLPRSVFQEPGEAADCTVENVKVTDGTVDMILTIYYTIPFELLERYLAAVGPQAPNEIIAVAAAQIARLRGSEASVGILISKARRDAVFAPPYCSHLATKLMSEAAIRLIKVTFDKVELIHDA
ncbi:hypothetical protein STCU_02262 [Strigomonas culicis]|nr:hypothetical protein STCU_02262 [Strigomonas culicis]|eukprot:EPY33366.1 hypothetical protein STCU_02262 [Strigomonas culicis]